MRKVSVKQMEKNKMSNANEWQWEEKKFLKNYRKKIYRAPKQRAPNTLLPLMGIRSNADKS